MYENLPPSEDLEEGSEEPSGLSVQEFATYWEELGQKIDDLSQEEVDAEILYLLKECSKGDPGKRALLSAAFLPNEVVQEERQTGQSSWAKVYRSLFNISKTAEYKENPEIQEAVFMLEEAVGQNPEIIGPVALWQIAKDVMWRKGFPSEIKNCLLDGLTYALAFSDKSEYEVELLKNLDLEKIDNYAETAHMLEALKIFWSAGHESYAEDRGTPGFYLNVLESIQVTPESNYLLSMRARELLSILEQSDLFPTEASDKTPFELS